MTEVPTDPGRPIADQTLAALLRTLKGRPILVEPDVGFARLELEIRNGKLDNYLHDWALRSSEGFRETLLVLCVKSNLAALVAALLERGADPNMGLVSQGATRKCPASQYDTPLGAAGNSEEITRLLLDAGANVHLLSRGSPPLLYARDIGAIRLLLEAGADPLAGGDSRSPLADALAVLPEGHERIRVLRTAAMKQLEGKRLSSISCKAGKHFVSSAEARGVRMFMQFWIDNDWDWAVSLVKASRSETTAALHDLFPKSEVHAPAKNAIFDAHRPIFVVELKGMPWTIVFDELGGKSLDGRIEEIGEPLSKKLGCEVLSFGNSKGLRYESGELLESHSNDWSVEVANVESGAYDVEDEELDSIEEVVLASIDKWFVDKDVFLPEASFASDGLLLKLELRGIKKKDVAGHDVVVVEESGGER